MTKTIPEWVKEFDKIKKEIEKEADKNGTYRTEDMAKISK